MAFRNVLLGTFCYRRFRSRRLPRRDDVIPLPSKLRGYFFYPCDSCCRCSVGCSSGRKGCVSPSDPFERFHRCPRFDNALLPTPKAWQNGLRLLTCERQSALYVTALQTLQRVVLEAGDRHGVVLHHLRHIHFCRAHQASHCNCSLSMRHASYPSLVGFV
jgi:hypothetical protein